MGAIKLWVLFFFSTTFLGTRTRLNSQQNLDFNQKKKKKKEKKKEEVLRAKRCVEMKLPWFGRKGYYHCNLIGICYCCNEAKVREW